MRPITRVVHRPAILLAWSLAVVSTLGACGCGPRETSGKVSGKVLLGTEPLGDVNVILCRSDGAAIAKASVHAGGEFTFDGPVPVGDYSVTIEAVLPELGPPGSGQVREPPKPRFAGKYGDWKRSGLKAGVKPGRNEFTFKLE